MTSVVYLWSQYVPTSIQYLSYIHQKGGRSICVDHPTIRKQIVNSDKIKVNQIPCLLVSSQGKISQYEGDKAIEWLFHSSEQKNYQNGSGSGSTPSENLHQSDQKTSLEESTNGNIKFQMTIKNQNEHNVPHISQIEKNDSIQLAKGAPVNLPSEKALTNPPLDVTPISKVIPEPPVEQDRSQFSQNMNSYNQQAMDYYQQFQTSSPSKPEANPKKLSPKEEEYQKILKEAKIQSIGIEGDSNNSVLGSSS